MKLEEIFQELDSIQEKLDNPNTALDEALVLFEKAVGLAKQCKVQLEDGKKKAVVLKTQLDEVVEEDITNELSHDNN